MIEQSILRTAFLLNKENLRSVLQIISNSYTLTKYRDLNSKVRQISIANFGDI